MAATTIAPWTVHEHAPYSVWGFGKCENTQVAACRVLLDDGTWDGYFPSTHDECEANARLIAAAPELLEALKHALLYAEHAVKFFKYQRPGREFWPNREEAEGNIAEMRAAIAKAEGRA